MHKQHNTYHSRRRAASDLEIESTGVTTHTHTEPGTIRPPSLRARRRPREEAAAAAAAAKPDAGGSSSSDSIIDTEELSSRQQQKQQRQSQTRQLAPGGAPAPLLPLGGAAGSSSSSHGSSRKGGPSLGLPPPHTTRVGGAAGGLPPSSPSRLSPAVAELLVVNVVVAWACVVLALGGEGAHHGGHRLEALALLALGLAAHAGIGPSQFRFAADAGMAVGLTALPCMLASLFLVSRNDGACVPSILYVNRMMGSI